MSVRLRIVLLVIGLWCVALTARLVGLQILDHDHYGDKARRQHQRVVDLDPSRGTVFDAEGRELAVSVPVDTAWADPARVPEDRRDELAQTIAQVLEVPVAEIAAELAKDKSFVYLGRRLDPPKAQALRQLDLPGVFFAEESKRYYPNGPLAASVLGYVGTDNAGLAGLELEYNAAVTGRAGRRTVLRDAKASTAISPNLAASAAQPGHDLVLTLDASIQHVLESELAKAVEKHHARRAMAVVLDANTGAVLAMASLPTFDPNHFASAPKENRHNFSIESSYEPGSTFKMVTASAALAANLIDPADMIDCEMGSITFGSTRIHDHKPFGVLSFREVIAKSSNVGAVKAGMRLGDERLYDAAHAFGFGRRTGIDLPGESSGILHPLDRWWSLSRAYVSFGHEVSITALQLASAFGAVANGGNLMRPYVVAEVRAAGEDPVRTEPEVVGRPVTSSTAREVERLLESVTIEGGTGKAAAIPGYTVAGKTGTAQKVSSTGRYLVGRYVASFAGFAPARRPEVVAAVVIDEPRPPWYHGGDVAAPVFSAVVEQVLLYRGIRPERDKPELWPGEAPAPVATVAALASAAGGAP